MATEWYMEGPWFKNCNCDAPRPRPRGEPALLRGRARPVRHSRRREQSRSDGFGPEGSEDFWIRPGEPGAPVHVAFAAHDRETVEAFHDAALAAGGRDYGPPALRPQYHAAYYAAYVLDPDGNNVEAVFHGRP
jgi:catechol 2,3-dioxygenase-like lactoylglutathione lyase family enzyme